MVITGWDQEYAAGLSPEYVNENKISTLKKYISTWLTVGCLEQKLQEGARSVWSGHGLSCSASADGSFTGSRHNFCSAAERIMKTLSAAASPIDIGEKS